MYKRQAMNPIAIDEAGVPESLKEAEIQVAIDKTKKEQVDKACLLYTSLSLGNLQKYTFIFYIDG